MVVITPSKKDEGLSKPEINPTSQKNPKTKT